MNESVLSVFMLLLSIIKAPSNSLNQKGWTIQAFIDGPSYITTYKNNTVFWTILNT